MQPQQIGLLSIPTSKGYEVRDIEMIEYLESDDQVTRIYMDDGEVIRGNNILGFFENQLKGNPFERVHNQVLVNLTKIKEYSRKDEVLILLSSTRISISREKGKKVLKFLKSSREDEEKTIYSEGDIASFIVQGEKGKQQILPIKKGKQLVGRKSQLKPCDIMIETDDKSMSRQHFFIESADNDLGYHDFIVYIKEDLKTSIDTEPMKPNKHYSLKNNSVIRAGETDILFVISSQPKTE